MKYYIDCEFDGHNGPLMSMAVVREDGDSIYVLVDAHATTPWVIENVVPVLLKHNPRQVDLVAVDPDGVGDYLRYFVADPTPTIVADSPVDIARFCTAISTDFNGGYSANDYPRMTFEVHDVDAYPTTLIGAVQHNAWWDAMALRHKLQGDAK